MRKSIKASLLSAFVFPGSGLLIVNKKKLGYFIIFGTLCYLYFLIIAAIKLTQEISQLLINNNFDIDVSEIQNKLTELQLEPNYQYLNYFSYLILLLWLYSIISSYQFGKKIELQNKVNVSS